MSLRRFLSKIVGNANERELDQMRPLVEAVNDLEPTYEALSERELRAQAGQFRARLQDGAALDDLLAEAYAAVREASKRTTGKRHYDVQILGGIALHRGYALEMKTGEGKTLVATLPLFLNALAGRGAHLVTVNDYLARRDVQWMGPIYDLLGLSVGLLQQGQDRSFLFDPSNSRSTDDYRLLRAIPRREAYAADITYGTNSEFGFDYLRDNSVYRVQDRVQRGFYYALVDEVDNILIDEARTPLIISGPATAPTDEYYVLAGVVKQLAPEDYEIDARTRGITLTDAGYDHVERLLDQPLFDPDHPEEITPQQAKLLHHLEQALKAEYTMHRDRDYIIQGQRVVIVDEFTGRTMPGRRWSDGLHQAVEAKEGVQVRQENVTYATITLQNYFRMYEKLAGMTGTAATEAEEFEKIYDLAVLVLPTHRPIAREDRADVVLRTEEGKFRAVVEDVLKQHCLGRPTLVGTTSVEVSERLSKRLDGTMIRRWASVALLRQHLNSPAVDNATYRSSIGGLNEPLDQLSASQLRKQGDALSISVDPTRDGNLEKLTGLLGLPDAERLQEALQRGVPHSVLNARQHTEEARIVARAGEVGAVTIATNMAGRGVDIKLGGELDEETVAQVNRVLRQNGVSPYGLEFSEMARELGRIDPERYYLYRDAVDAFLKHVADEERVKELGGLHVIGTERHEARRIDNQLRGRSGRQGDPGSSTFYLSLEDDLMRRFGGSRVSDLAARLAGQDDMPISLGIVSRAIANAQTQVEGYNFDIRKHLIDYDDVLNTQRNVIYEQRKRILTKPDLRDDVWAMVESELQEHIDPLYAADPRTGELAEEERIAAAWRLVNYLEQVQPVTAVSEGTLFPSFALQHVLSTLPVEDTPKALRAALSETMRGLLDALQRAVRQAIERTVQRALETEPASVERFLEAATLAYETVELEAEEAGQMLDARRAGQAIEQGTGIELDVRDMRDLEGRQLERALLDQVRARAQFQVRLRLLAQVQARLSVRWEAPAALLAHDASTTEGAQALIQAILDGVTEALAPQQAGLLREIEADIQAQIRTSNDCTPARVTQFLHQVRFGTRSGFDKQHRRVSQRVERLQYTPWVAEQIAGWDRERLETAIRTHLQNALAAWESAWGDLELQRIGSNTLAELDQETQAGLKEILGDQRLAELQDARVLELQGTDREALHRYLSERVLFNVQRQLMLDTTSRYWVEHLTAIEVLRQGVGLQSYAQKDPLAEYRVRAYEMFQNLLRAIQADVVTGMFTYRPRDLSQVRVGVERKRAGSTPSQGQQRRQRPKGQRPRKRRKRR